MAGIVGKSGLICGVHFGGGGAPYTDVSPVPWLVTQFLSYRSKMMQGPKWSSWKPCRMQTGGQGNSLLVLRAQGMAAGWELPT